MITNATPADHARLCEIWESAVRATHDFLSAEDFDYYHLRIPMYLQQLELYVSMTEDGNIQGFLAVADSKIEMLFVDAAARGQGVGKKLLHYATETLGAKSLDVNEQNAQAVGFYRHAGFVPTGRTETDGEGKPYPLLQMELPSE